MPENKHLLKVFLCHASQDKPAVRELYQRLKDEGWIDPWLDVARILPGQHWTTVIRQSLAEADSVIIFISNNSVNREGFVRREMNYAWDLSLEKPRNVIYLIPLRIEECDVPYDLRERQWADYFGKNKDETYRVLLLSLELRYDQKLRLEEEELTRQEIEKQEREFAEKIAREKAERDAAEKALLEKVEREAEEKNVREKAEREAAQKAILEKLENEAAEKARREKERRKVAEEKALRKLHKKNLQKSESQRPKHKYSTQTFFRVLGIIAAIILIISLSSLNFKGAPLTLVPTSTVYVEPLSIEITDDKGVEMMLVPAGEFTMGSNTGNDDEKPIHTVYLDTFYIDKYEVTNIRYKACVDTGVCQPPSYPGSYTRSLYFGDSQYDNYPVIFVNWYMAKNYCDWRDSRLPTEAEWEKAARSDDERSYPWGEGIDCSKANHADCVGDTVEVGSYIIDQSPYGVYDMAGGVWEWVNSLYQPYPYIAVDGREKLSTVGDRVMRGGGWSKGIPNARSSYRTYGNPSHDTSPDIGFRCAITP